MGLGDLRAGVPRGRCAAPTRTGLLKASARSLLRVAVYLLRAASQRGGGKGRMFSLPVMKNEFESVTNEIEKNNCICSNIL